MRVAVPGRVWVRHPSGVVEGAAAAAPHAAFAVGGVVVDDEGAVLGQGAAGEASAAAAGGVAVYATGDQVAARAPARHRLGRRGARGGAGGGHHLPRRRRGGAAAAGSARRFHRVDAGVGAAETWLSCRVGSTWRAPLRLSAPGHDTTATAIAVDPAGRALVVWRDRDADRLEYVVATPTGGVAAPTALRAGARAAAAAAVRPGVFALLYAGPHPGRPSLVIRRSLVLGRLGRPVRMGSGAAVTPVGVTVDALGRQAYAWLASARPGGRPSLFVRYARRTTRLHGRAIAAGAPALNPAGDLAVPVVRDGAAGLMIVRGPMRLRVVHPPAKALGGATLRLRLRVAGALQPHRIRSSCGARTVATSAAKVVVLVQVPRRHDLACTFRIAERGSSARASLTIRALAPGHRGSHRGRAGGARRVRAGSDGAGLRASGGAGADRGAGA